MSQRRAAESMTDQERETYRVNVNFSKEAYETLRALANKRGKSIADTLRDAIALEAWFQKTEDEGGNILVERNGKAREIVRP